MISIDRVKDQQTAYRNNSIGEAHKELLIKVGFDFTGTGLINRTSWETHYENYAEHVRFNGAYASIPREKKSLSQW